MADAIAVPASEGARILGVKPKRFFELVDQGIIPPARRELGDPPVWLVDELRAIFDGTAAKPKQEFEL